MSGRTVLVQGVLGAVGSLAAQLATWGGVTVIGTVVNTADLARVDRSAVPHVVALNDGDPTAAIRAHAPQLARLGMWPHGAFRQINRVDHERRAEPQSEGNSDDRGSRHEHRHEAEPGAGAEVPARDEISGVTR